MRSRSRGNGRMATCGCRCRAWMGMRWCGWWGLSNMLTPTLDMLRAAIAGDYAIGGFNVYNREGARAVVAAAEAERSPAMLQIHPSALAHGGHPLIALCMEAARR